MDANDQFCHSTSELIGSVYAKKDPCCIQNISIPGDFSRAFYLMQKLPDIKNYI